MPNLLSPKSLHELSLLWHWWNPMENSASSNRQSSRKVVTKEFNRGRRKNGDPRTLLTTKELQHLGLKAKS